MRYAQSHYAGHMVSPDLGLVRLRGIGNDIQRLERLPVDFRDVGIIDKEDGLFLRNVCQDAVGICLPEAFRMPSMRCVESL